MATPFQFFGSQTSKSPVPSTRIFLSHLTLKPIASYMGSAFVKYSKSIDTLLHSPIPAGSSPILTTTSIWTFFLLHLLPSVHFRPKSQNILVLQHFQLLAMTCTALHHLIVAYFSNFMSHRSSPFPPLQLRWTFCCSPNTPSQSHIKDLSICFSLCPECFRLHSYQSWILLLLSSQLSYNLRKIFPKNIVKNAPPPLLTLYPVSTVPLFFLTLIIHQVQYYTSVCVYGDLPSQIEWKPSKRET